MEAQPGSGTEVLRDSGQGHVVPPLVPYTGVHKFVRRFLEPVQDILVVVLAVALFAVMARALISIVSNVLGTEFSFSEIISQALFVLVLLELQRLLIIYLRDHHVSVDVMVEATIVGALREVLLLIAVGVEPARLYSLTVFVLALGLLLRLGDLRASSRRVHSRGAGHRDGSPHAHRSETPVR